MKRLLLLIPMALCLAAPVAAQPVEFAPDAEGTLAARWEWALRESRGDRAVWIGYAIDRWGSPNAFVGTWYDPVRRDLVTLHERLYGTPPEPEDETVRDAAARALERMNRSERKIQREVALLFRYEGGTLRRVELSNVTLHVDLHALPLYWLGKANDDASLAHLTRLYDGKPGTALREDLVTAVGLHEDSDRSFGFLRDVLASDAPADVREKAAFWIGQRESDAALALLLRTARTDASTDVREHAVFAFSQMDRPDALDALIDLARHETNNDVRGKAVFWLGQKASKQALATLKDIARDDAETNVQKQAVFALAQSDDADSVPLLIDLAKTHPNPQIRKHAIFMLGQSEDPRALDALVTFARGQ